MYNEEQDETNFVLRRDGFVLQQWPQTFDRIFNLVTSWISSHDKVLEPAVHHQITVNYQLDQFP